MKAPAAEHDSIRAEVLGDLTHGVRERVVKEGVTTWATPVRRLGWGFVDWQTTIATLKSMQFTGPISMHSEYADEPPETVIDLARADTRFIRHLLDTATKE